MYNAAKAIRISTIVASLRLQPAKHIAAKKFSKTISTIAALDYLSSNNFKATNDICG